LDKSKDFDTSNGYSVWEDDFLENEPNQDGPHPNRIGYRMIAEFLYESIKDKKVILLFEGEMSEPQIYLNGQKVGDWAYGYSYFYFDVTDLIQEGENSLSVKLTNKELDEWFLLMHKQNLKYGCRDWFENEFLENIYSKFENRLLNLGTFCRDCEQKLFTINADGTIAGCPNSAPEQYYGHITQEIKDLVNSPKRMEIISCETHRDSRCYECPVFQYCGGDCHQLEWQDDVCGAPKSLMRNLAGINNSKNKIFLIKEL
jgi:radical SAM protein with 4Fe4S-binding SPASM domain